MYRQTDWLRDRLTDELIWGGLGTSAKENEALLKWADNLSMVGQPASFIIVVMIDDDAVYFPRVGIGRHMDNWQK